MLTSEADPARSVRSTHRRWARSMAAWTIPSVVVGCALVLAFLAAPSQRHHAGTLVIVCIPAELLAAAGLARWSSVSPVTRMCVGSILATELVPMLLAGAPTAAAATSLEAASGLVLIAGCGVWSTAQRARPVPRHAGSLAFATVAGALVSAGVADLWRPTMADAVAYGAWLGLVLALALFGFGQLPAVRRSASPAKSRADEGLAS